MEKFNSILAMMDSYTEVNIAMDAGDQEFVAAFQEKWRREATQ